MRGLFTNTAAPGAPQPAQCADRNGACRGPIGELKPLDCSPQQVLEPVPPQTQRDGIIPRRNSLFKRGS